MADITTAQITEGKVDGTGAFDLFMKAINVHIGVEYAAGRISGAEYPSVYLGALQTALTQAVQFVTGKQIADKQADLLAQKKITEDAQTVDSTGGTTKKQQDLISAQTEGFARDAEQKLAKIVSDAYAVQRTTDNTLGPPSSLASQNIDDIMAIAKAGIT